MKKPHILIVDDEEDIRFTLDTALQAEGYMTTMAASGADALAIVEARKPDLILLDIMMPEIDGYEVCRRIKENEATKHTAIVFASVLRKTQDKVDGLDMGADDYITKPFNMPELLAKLRALFRVKEYQRHLERLVDFAHSVNELDPDDIADAISEKLENLLVSDRFSVFIKNEDDDTLRVLAHNHDGAEMDDLSLLNAQSPIMNKAISTGELVYVKDFKSSDYSSGDKRNKYTDSYALCIPLKVGPEVLGALNINGNSKGFFDHLDLNSAELAAEMISASLNNSRRLEQLRKLAITDGLTKLYNRRYFYELLQKEFERAKRFNQPLSLVMIDIDYFKKINDKYGHLVGDVVLEELARRLKKHVRIIDTVARYGGEEFAILLPQADLNDGVLVAERVRSDVGSGPVETPEGPVNITVSLGVCDSIPDSIRKPEDLMNRSDEALYKAKAQGRNQTCVYTEETNK